MPPKRRYAGESKSAWDKRKKLTGPARTRANTAAKPKVKVKKKRGRTGY